MLAQEETRKKTEGDKKPDAAITAKSDKTKDGPSSLRFLNTLLLYTIVLGFGAILGYYFFSVIYDHRCSDLIDEAEKNFSVTREALTHQLKEALESSSSVDESEILELRGLTSKQESTIEDMKKKSKKDDETVLQLMARNDQYKEILTAHQTKTKEVETKLNSIEIEKNNLESEMKKLQERGHEASAEHIRHLHTTLTLEKFEQGPYYIQMGIEIEGESDGANFLIEVSTLELLPTSVFVFMTLVDIGAYTGAEFLSTQSIIHMSSDEEKARGIGYVQSGLRLIENSEHGGCGPYSIGFVGAKGGLKIIMTSDTSRHGSLACFGRIVQGRQIITQIQRASKEGKSVAISDVHLAKIDSPPTFQEGEL